MTPETAKERLTDLEIIITQNTHRTCPDCMCANFFPELGREKVINKFYPNYGNLIKDRTRGN